MLLKILQAALLAAVLVPLGSVGVEADTIFCDFGEYFGDGGEGCSPQFSEGGNQQAEFDFGPYFLALTMYDISGVGSISVTDNPLSQGELDERTGHDLDIEAAGRVGIQSHLGDYDCIPLVAPDFSDPGCRTFTIVADSGLTWSRWEVTIDWMYDSHNNGFGGPASIHRVLRDTDDDGFFDEDMCLVAGDDLGDDNYVPCEYSPFPFIFTGDTDFSTITAAVALNVPEPATFALFGTAAAALLYRRRRKRGGGHLNLQAPPRHS